MAFKFIFISFLLLNVFVCVCMYGLWCVHGCTYTIICVDVREQDNGIGSLLPLNGVGSLLPLWGSQGLYPGCQAQWQVPWPIEPSCQSIYYILMSNFETLFQEFTIYPHPFSWFSPFSSWVCICLCTCVHLFKAVLNVAIKSTCFLRLKAKVKVVFLYFLGMLVKYSHSLKSSACKLGVRLALIHGLLWT